MTNSECCCFYWPPVCEVNKNYEVVESQPHTLTTLDLGSVAYCYVAYLLEPTHTLILPSNVPPPKLLSSALIPPGIICPPGRHPSLSHHTKKIARLSLTRHFQRLTPPICPHPQHACWTPVAAAPTLPQKYLLLWLLVVFPHPPVSTTALKTSPLPRIPSPLHIPRR